MKYLFLLTLICLFSCVKEQVQKQGNDDLKISLAQWSLHKSFFDGKIDPFDFPLVAKEKYDIFQKTCKTNLKDCSARALSKRVEDLRTSEI